MPEPEVSISYSLGVRAWTRTGNKIQIFYKKTTPDKVGTSETFISLWLKNSYMKFEKNPKMFIFNMRVYGKLPFDPYIS